MRRFPEITISIRRFNRFSSLIGLFFIITIGFVIRWYNLPERGIIARDEAWHVYSARGLETRFQNQSAQSQNVLQASKRSELPDFERISSNNVAGKPTYVGLLWLIGKIRGLWDYDSVWGLSLFAGVANTMMVFSLSRKAQLDSLTALLASLSVSFSFISIYFSRVGYPHALLILVHSLALYLYLHADASRPASSSLFWAGLVWGVGLSIHMSLILAMPGLFFSELYQHRKNIGKNINVLFRRSLLVGGGVLSVLLGWEIVYRVALHMLGSGSGVISLSGSFLGDLLIHAESGGFDFNFISNLMFYGFALLGMENPLSSLFFLIGLVSIWRMMEDDGGRVLSIFFATNFLFLIFYPAQYGRQLAPLMSIWPVFMANGIAVSLGALKGFAFSGKNTISAMMVIFICLGNLYWVWPLLSAKSTGWVAAARWLQVNASPSDQVFTSEISDAALLDYYLPGRVTVWPYKEDELPVQVQWYVNNPTTRFVPAWSSIYPLIDGKRPSAVFADPWLLLRPHSVISGNWLLIPWWRWSNAPRSYQAGVDDIIQVFSIP